MNKKENIPSDVLYLAEKLDKVVKKQNRRATLLFMVAAGLGYLIETQIENLNDRIMKLEELSSKEG